MKVLVLHNATTEDASVEDRDVLTQRDAIVAALEQIGNTVATFGCSLDLNAVREHVEAFAPDVVFNLVESLGQTDRLMPLVPLLLDALAVPYTGAPSQAMLALSSKAVAKKRLQEASLPTPEWFALGQSAMVATNSPDARWIIKPIWEHASVGMDDQSIVSEQEMPTEVIRRNRRSKRPLFAERFVDGREFNLSLLAGSVLPPAEIEFRGYPEDKPKIVCHRAKWDADSFEYQQTPRRFDFPEADIPLLEHLIDLAQKCWDLFELRGFARVDFRVDTDGQPWILEVNVNPCLSPDAGFAAALNQAGIPFSIAIEKIIVEAMSPPSNLLAETV